MEQIALINGERIDDLQFNNLKIIQNENLYAFTCDAVLLANFVKCSAKDNIVDLCSGSGIVGILSQAKTGAKHLTCVEMQQQMADMCKKSVQLNNLQEKIDVVNCKVQGVSKVIGNEKFSVVVCNPPYKRVDAHKISEKREIGVCKYELELNFDELAKETSKILKYGGKFFFVHETCRMTEIFGCLQKYNLEPKRVKLIYPKAKASSHIMLVEATKGAKGGIIFEQPEQLN